MLATTTTMESNFSLSCNIDFWMPLIRSIHMRLARETNNIDTNTHTYAARTKSHGHYIYSMLTLFCAHIFTFSLGPFFTWNSTHTAYVASGAWRQFWATQPSTSIIISINLSFALTLPIFIDMFWFAFLLHAFYRMANNERFAIEKCELRALVWVSCRCSTENFTLTVRICH